MKKKYEKPGMYVENFALTQSIAQSCGYDRVNGTLGQPTNGDPEHNCGWSTIAGTYWMSTSVCSKIVDLDFDLGGSCYNAPAGGTSLFAS